MRCDRRIMDQSLSRGLVTDSQKFKALAALTAKLIKRIGN
ncbi:hypothetical protein HMPREF9061_01685 [Actinomyces sp. oral taxon 181 str. F0379]|nr:hypothetical protein HMPREF9061_01685 [Actinomyces sp. oral taxon 181 str. F0379]